MRYKSTGIHISGEFVWEIHEYELGSLLFALPSLVPTDSVAKDIRDFLLTHPAPVITKVHPGTRLPTPQIFHVPAVPSILSRLAEMAENHCSYDICEHLHVYRGNKVLLQCHDFSDLPLMLSDMFTEQQVSDFSQKIGGKYEKRRISD